MPPVAQKASGSHARYIDPPNPNRGTDTDAHITRESISHQPSPAIVTTTSHVGKHVLPRRFLGPMPEQVVNSDEAVEKRRRFANMRTAALRRIRRTDEDGLGGQGGFGDQGGRRESLGRVVRKIRVRRRNKHGEDVDEDVDLEDAEDSDSEEFEGKRHRFGRKKKKKRKHVWIGESFDVGREFFSAPKSAKNDTAAPDGFVDQSVSDTAVQPERPSNPSRSTLETFVTARTEMSVSATTSKSSLSFQDPVENGYHLNIDNTPSPLANPSLAPQDNPVRNSQTSSMQPLIASSPQKGEGPKFSKGKHILPDTVSSSGHPTPSELKKRLKSAIRKSPAGPSRPAASAIHSVSKGGGIDGNNVRAKTVHFPVGSPRDLSQALSYNNEQPRKGNKAPADPEAVLARGGSDAAGTSAGAADEAIIHDSSEEDEEDVLPGEVIMRDRMLVRIGHHQEENIPVFDEASQRRNPCSRMEPMEEFIVIWRKGRVEFYQDWDTPLMERIKGQKRLCFIVPLLHSRTSLSIFNDTDMTLSLTTSAGKLEDDVEHIMHSSSHRSDSTRDRLSQSRQARWLKPGRKGTHVFVMKVAERSRAFDWYWELWRDLGGELPKRIDIDVPSLSTSLRLLLPEGEDMVGDRKVCRELSPKNTVKTCWEMMGKAIDLQDLLDQRNDMAGDLDLELAWKAGDGSLDWVAHRTTVTGRARDWAVLAGVAKVGVERFSRTLQLRPARHQPRSIRLEDGSTIEEPSGVEGYLIRHKSAGVSKEHVYVSSHDGNIFIANMREAHPPVMPSKEASTPAELFPEVNHAFLEQEHHRMARFIEHSAGCVDLRDVTGVKLCEVTSDRALRTDHEQEQELEDGEGRQRLGKQSERSFEVALTSGSATRFEAHTPSDASEWVEKLNALQSYWKRRHRVDARLRMDAIALHASDDPFAGTNISNENDNLLADVWDWCTIKGCRSICLSGRLFLKKGAWSKFRPKHMVLTGGCLVSFKVKSKQVFHQRRARYPLFGAYVYSGMFARDELHEAIREDVLSSRARVYQDGLQSSDGAEDTTFCVRLSAPTSSWGMQRTDPWNIDPDATFFPPPLSKSPPLLLIFRARSKLERDRWVWAINAEMERQVRAHTKQENALREYGKVPAR